MADHDQAQSRPVPTHPYDEEKVREDAREQAKLFLQQGPNKAFHHWQQLSLALRNIRSMGDVNNTRELYVVETLREFFEDLGHWRDLRPNVITAPVQDLENHHARQKAMENFVAQCRLKLRIIHYDVIRRDHVDNDGYVKYRWTYVLNDVPQVMLTVEPGNVEPPHNDELRREFFKPSAPNGYSILEKGDRIEGFVYFENHEFWRTDPCFSFFVEPEMHFAAGDYELRWKAPLQLAGHVQAQDEERVVGQLERMDDNWAKFRFASETFYFPTRRRAQAAIGFLWEKKAFTLSAAVHEEEICKHVWGASGVEPRSEMRLKNFFGKDDDSERFFRAVIKSDHNRRYFLNVAPAST